MAQSLLRVPPSLLRSLAATKVEYRQLGKNCGLRVSFPSLGAMSLGDATLVDWVKEGDDALAVLKAAYDAGINTWVTSNRYSNGESERLLGRAMKEFSIPRRKLVLMTKCVHYVGEEQDVIGAVNLDKFEQSRDYVNQGGLSRTAIFNAVDASLERLGTSYLDVLTIHRYDPNVSPEETMRALHDLVQSGKVRYIGASSMWCTQLQRLNTVAERNGWTKFALVEAHYNLCYREEERETLRYCREEGMGVMPWSPLFGGKLGRPAGEPGESSRSKMGATGHQPGLTGADREIIERVGEVARKRNEAADDEEGEKEKEGGDEEKWTMSHVAMAWLKSKGTVPVVGFNSPKRVGDALGIKGKELTVEECKYLEEPYAARAIIGHE